MSLLQGKGNLLYSAWKLPPAAWYSSEYFECHLCHEQNNFMQWFTNSPTVVFAIVHGEGNTAPSAVIDGMIWYPQRREVLLFIHRLPRQWQLTHKSSSSNNNNKNSDGNESWSWRRLQATPDATDSRRSCRERQVNYAEQGIDLHCPNLKPSQAFSSQHQARVMSQKVHVRYTVLLLRALSRWEQLQVETTREKQTAIHFRSWTSYNFLRILLFEVNGAWRTPAPDCKQYNNGDSCRQETWWWGAGAFRVQLLKSRWQHTANFRANTHPYQNAFSAKCLAQGWSEPQHYSMQNTTTGLWTLDHNSSMANMYSNVQDTCINDSMASIVSSIHH